MYKNHNSILQKILSFVTLEFCPEYNINTIRDNLQPLSEGLDGV